jgi:hypothetical protein
MIFLPDTFAMSRTDRRPSSRPLEPRQRAFLARRSDTDLQEIIKRSAGRGKPHGTGIGRSDCLGTFDERRLKDPSLRSG